MIVRPKTESDLPELGKIYEETCRQIFPDYPAETFRAEDFAKETRGEWVIVVEDDRGLIGFASVWEKNNFLHYLYVRTDCRGSGVGGLLLRACVDHMGRPARLKCGTANTASCRFYESQGWVIESTTEDGPLGPYHTYILSK